MDVLKRDQHALVGRNVHTGNTGHEVSPVADSAGTGWFFRFDLGRVFTNANTTPFPLDRLGARHRLKTIRLDTGLIKGFNLRFVNRLWRFSSLFRELFGGFSGLLRLFGPLSDRLAPLQPAFSAFLEAVSGRFRGGFGALLEPSPPSWPPCPCRFRGLGDRCLTPFWRSWPFLGFGALAALCVLLASTAPISASSTRLMSAVTSSMVIMPSIVSSLRRSE